MIGMEMTYGKQPETAKTELGLFPRNLGCLAGIKEINLPIELHCQ
jgi:hypothetical protein